jgi:proteic killer suppression protein
MEIEYKTNKLEKSLASPRDILAYYGTRAKLVKQRMDEFKAAVTLHDILLLPKANLHQLTQRYTGCLAVDISANYRIIIEPNHNPVPLKDDNGLDYKSVTKIKILEIVDYH